MTIAIKQSDAAATSDASFYQHGTESRIQTAETLERKRSFIRNSTSLILVTSLHVFSGGLLIYQWTTSAPVPAPEPVVLVDMEPLPPAPIVPAPEPAASRPSPAPSIARTVSTPQIITPPAVDIERIEVPSFASTPVVSYAQSDELETSPPPLPSTEPTGRPTFEGLLLARIEQFKRYPEEAQSRNEEGVVHLRFRMNRDGRVLDSSVVRGSGRRSLDREALATLRRAEPLPRIPDDRPAIMEVTVPIEFFLRRQDKQLAEARAQMRSATKPPIN